MHRAAGATEVLICSAKRFAILHELRERAGVGPAATCSRSLSPVDLVLVEGFKRDAFPEARNPSRGERQAAAPSGRSAYRRHRLRHAAAAGHACR